jgi:hypothetical protein
VIFLIFKTNKTGTVRAVTHRDMNALQALVLLGLLNFVGGQEFEDHRRGGGGCPDPCMHLFEFVILNFV